MNPIVNWRQKMLEISSIDVWANGLNRGCIIRVSLLNEQASVGYESVLLVKGNCLAKSCEREASGPLVHVWCAVLPGWHLFPAACVHHRWRQSVSTRSRVR